MNSDQKQTFHSIMQSIEKKSGQFFFVHGHRGTGKTYLWRTLLSKVRSKRKIALAVASCGIAALLLQAEE